MQELRNWVVVIREEAHHEQGYYAPAGEWLLVRNCKQDYEKVVETINVTKERVRDNYETYEIEVWRVTDNQLADFKYFELINWEGIENV